MLCRGILHPAALLACSLVPGITTGTSSARETGASSSPVVSQPTVSTSVRVNMSTLPSGQNPNVIRVIPEGEPLPSSSLSPVVSESFPATAVKVDMKALTRGEEPSTTRVIPEGEPLPTSAPHPKKTISDRVIQTQQGDRGEALESLLDPRINVAGQTSFAAPPDAVGAVGRNHYVQMVNATSFQIFDKQGNDLSGGSLSFGALWPQGNACRANAGDPIVVYDHLADRWLLSQLNTQGSNSFVCVAISQTPDPTEGSWYLYTIRVPVFPDYPKFGVWPDAYYLSTYEGSDLGVFALDRAAMLNGAATRFVRFTISSLTPVSGIRETRILPSDLNGPPPPNRTPNFFFRSVNTRQDTTNPTDRLEIWQFSVNWPNPSASSFTLATTITTPDLAPFNVMACNRTGTGIRDCIPQPNTTQTVDALSNRPMMQLKYRNFGDHEALVTNQTVNVQADVGSTQEVAGIRWYELRRSRGDRWSIYQQGTYAPQPIAASADNQFVHRWMGSAAMDKFGNLAVGYSVSNGDSINPVFPSIRYAGRLATDPLDLILERERIIFDGTDSQTDQSRWGDYSNLSVDPVDDCTFWYTTHVAPPGGVGGRPTRIASFSFDSCRSNN